MGEIAVIPEPLGFGASGRKIVTEIFIEEHALGSREVVCILGTVSGVHLEFGFIPFRLLGYDVDGSAHGA